MTLFERITKIFPFVGLRSRIKALEQRSMSWNTSFPLSSGNWLEWFGNTVRSGANVSNQTADAVTAFNRAVVSLSEAVGGLPFDVYRVDDEGRTKDKNHNIDFLLNVRPNLQQTPFTLRARMVTALMKKGNSYHFIERDATGKPIALIDLNNIPVHPFQTMLAGRQVTMYDVQGFKMPLMADDVFHIVGWGDNPIIGRNPIQVHAETLGISISTIETKGAIYGNLGNISGVLESDLAVTNDQRRDISKAWREKYAESKNAGKVAVLGHGFKFKPIQLSPADSKVLEAEEFQVDEVARMTGVPPHKLFKLTDATLNNMEVMNSEFTQTVNHICTRIEQEARLKLFDSNEQRFYEVNANLYYLSRGDMKSRSEYWHKFLQDGVVMPNEVREAEGFRSVEAGNIFYRPLNMSIVDADGNTITEGQAVQDTAQPIENV